MASIATSAITPAQLGFLAIFNPSLGATDATIDDQIVYYASINTQSQKRRHRSRGKPIADISQDERNERLRQIGLAQGMVDFSRGFASGEPVDNIETEKTRVVLHEVEPGWWILASVDLTKIPLPPRLGPSTAGKQEDQTENVEYSSRELKPAMLLTQDLLRAHSVFLLHHAASLSALFVKSRRPNFVKMLSRYWDMWLSTWDVMLHGNPAISMLSGIKMAACGELGVGVGEEDRGSGEREVLEGFVGRVEGLVDLIVSRFDPPQPESETTVKESESSIEPPAAWLGTGETPKAEDGAVFLGVGALSRKSLRDVTYWMEDIYTWGENAYGVKESPTSTRSTRNRQRSIKKPTSNYINAEDAASRQFEENAPPESNESAQAPGDGQEGSEESGAKKWMGYFKMGYGTHWTLGNSSETTDDAQGDTTATQNDELKKSDACPRPAVNRNRNNSTGHYLIGLLGDIEEPNARSATGSQASDEDTELEENNSRVSLRTLTVELDTKEPTNSVQLHELASQSSELIRPDSNQRDEMDPNSQFASQDRNKTQKMRVVVYVNQPFVFAFVFQNRTDSLEWDVLYRSLHHQLSPLRKPLMTSTSYRPNRLDGEGESKVFDLVWDPKKLTVHSSIPSIPPPSEIPQENQVWSRAEAVNTHTQMLAMYTATLRDWEMCERTCKTNRGWWVVWTRILERDVSPPAAGANTATESDTNTEDGDQASSSSKTPTAPTVATLVHQESTESDGSNGPLPELKHEAKTPKVEKEIFLIRRAGEYGTTGGSPGVMGAIGESGSSGWTEGARNLAQGIGVDTNRYIEGLLSLGR
ncbi:hypothetical protein GGR57DRAFT_478031 [Xylariaceae sp. FL1272]|nr:hypothetical protein GGR57DRAFT_478031 [Xylariaceae sp. FL1272]